MALPNSGQLSIFDIASELGSTSGSLSLFLLSDAAGFSQPYAISNFYGYSAVTAVDLAGRITINQFNSYFYEYVFPIVSASGNHTGNTQLYVELTLYGINYNVGRVGFFTHSFTTDIYSFQATEAEFALRVNGIGGFRVYRIDSIDFWTTSSTETVNIVSLTT